MLFTAYNFRFLIFENGWNKKIHELDKLVLKKDLFSILGFVFWIINFRLFDWLKLLFRE